MHDMRQRYLPDWIILGDNSRAVFLDWFLSGTRLNTDENSVVWIRYGNRLSATCQASHWMIESPAVLPRTTICLPPADGFESAVDTSKRTKYAVLEEFPFRKQSSADLIRKLESNGRETLVVLMDLPRHQGSTDLAAPGEDLNQAANAYRSEGCDVLIAQSERNLHGLLHWHRPVYEIWTKRARNYFAELCQRVSEISYDYPLLEEDWQEDGGLLREDTMDALFSCQNAKRAKGNNLWDRFAAVSRQALFPRSGSSPLTSVEELYRDCLDNPLVFWSVETDAKDFMDSIQGKFWESLESEETKGHYREKTRLSERFDEDEYFRLVSRSGGNGTALNAVYSQRIRDFLCNDVKFALQERLQKRCQQLEDMIR